MAADRENGWTRTATEDVSRAREHQLELALQASRMVAWEWDALRNVVTTTDNLPEIYGVPGVEMAEHGFALVHPDDLERHRATVDRALATGESYRSEFRIVRPDNGAMIWMEERGTPVLDEAGSVFKLVGVVMDITDRKEAEEAQQRLYRLAEASASVASSLDYEATLHSLAQAVVPQIADWCAVHVVDEDGAVRQIAVNHLDPAKVALVRELERRFPYNPDAGSGVPQVLRSGQPELVAALSDELLEKMSPDPDRLQVVRELRITSWMIVPLAARGNLLGAITLVAAESGRHYGPDDMALADVLARRAALAIDNARLYHEARRVAAEQSAILSQMTDGVAMVDRTGRFAYLNEAARRLTGAGPADSLDEALGRLRVTTVSGAPYPLDQLPLPRALARGETTVDARWQLQHPDGRHVIVQSSATPVLGENGELLAAVSTVRDVTAQVTLEQQKEEFLTAAAHDLRTPLTSVKGLAQILQRRLTRDPGTSLEKLHEGLASIERNASRMNTLINELLDLSRLQMGEGLDLYLRPMDLVSFVSQCVSEHQQGAGTQRIALESRVPELTGNWDGDRLERVFGNLLSNAIKYSRPETPITVTVKREESDGRAWAVVSVEDRGIGIPREDLPQIFDRFHRGANVGRETLGTGIGLSGARQIVEQHGGAIEVTSEEGQGSTFTVRLPIAPLDG